MKFTTDMIGKYVREISTGDLGIVESDYHSLVHRGETIMVKWTTGSEKGQSLTIRLSSVEFIDSTPSNIADDVIVEIAGVKYKLVPL